MNVHLKSLPQRALIVQNRIDSSDKKLNPSDIRMFLNLTASLRGNPELLLPQNNPLPAMGH